MELAPQPGVSQRLKSTLGNCPHSSICGRLWKFQRKSSSHGERPTAAASGHGLPERQEAAVAPHGRGCPPYKQRWVCSQMVSY